MVADTNLNGPPRRLLRQFKAAVIRAGIPVERMILFGSRARGDAGPWSDIDVCVVSRRFGRDRFGERVRLARIAVHIEPLIEPVGLHPRELSDPWDSLAAAIRADGISIR